ncbi:signal peptide, CUB and EGF-like domain-containing protein 3 isoform X1 [Mytilus galloprovincialis]|uniref:Signal peptide, CUB and EGF-like domain-containing protein 1 n=1 Tax=Mytilus galloprovincialis TaxID=29158 RepID=A0A8B6GCS4_MYTGA|nr:Hypothetical predicted protein [Mytilus galloprovincialis]
MRHRSTLFAILCLCLKTAALQDNIVDLDLRNGVVKGYSPYISFVQQPTKSGSFSCDKQVVLKIDFSGKYDGARFMFEYGEPPRMWTIDISDSPTGDGYGGDNGTTSNMAEMQVHNKQLRIYGNNLKGHMDASSDGGLLIRTIDDFIRKGSRVKMDISDERLEYKSGKTKDYIESRFLYTLKGQDTEYGLKDYSVYVGLNRVVAGSYRSGSGLCRATITLYSLPEDACKKGTHDCHKDAICISTRKSYTCKCNPGYYDDKKVCKDRDECNYDNGGCVHFCHNTPGNYTCSCKPGFILDKDGQNCIDENECFTAKGGCQHQCVNSMGSYECRCNAGYSLASADSKSCQFGRWCQDRLKCEHFCQPNGKCGCRQGYRLHSDGKHCIRTCSAGNGGCQHNCTDTPEGTACICAPKYLLMSDQRTCVATCEVNNGGCDRKCTDSQKGPTCSCPKGYKLHQDGRTCLDVDECEINNGECSHQCVNNVGSYECVCPKGFKVEINQRNCVDINECEVNSTCDHTCVNTPGSYHCQCDKGYQLYGITHCADIDECSINDGGCENECKNTEGGFRCSCRNGFKLHSNGKDCIPNNICDKLTQPSNSRLNCKKENDKETCNFQCQRTAKSATTKDNFALECGPNTEFKWKFGNSTVTSLPHCSKTIKGPKLKRTVTFLFVADKCRTRRSLRELIRRNITQQLNEQKKYNCRQTCNVNTVEIDCNARLPKRFRKYKKDKQAVVAAELEMEIDSLPVKGKCDAACTTKRTERRMKKALKKMRKAANKKDFFFRYDKADRYILKKSLKFKKKVDFSCSDGFLLVKEACVACSVGTFFDKKQKQCKICQRGTYQDKEGQTLCNLCPQVKLGIGILGAVNITQCTVLCPPGSYSKDGMLPCLDCPKNFYQSEYGRLRCVPCGGGLETTGLGSRSFKQCSTKATCSPGHFYDIQTHTCKVCPTGSYQMEYGQNYCTACPGDTITDEDATTNVSECKNAACGGLLGKFHGFIQSPNYPGNYPNNRECIWRIKPGKKRRILVIIPEVFLQQIDKCGDILVMRQSKKPSSLTSYEACETKERPIAFTSRSKRMWIQFKSDGKNTAAGFSIPYVTYNEEYQPLIEDIVKDGRLYNSYQHQHILKDRKLLNALMEVIAQPLNYFKYANVSHTLMPQSFIKLLTSKVRRFFSS